MIRLKGGLKDRPPGFGLPVAIDLPAAGALDPMLNPKRMKAMLDLENCGILNASCRISIGCDMCATRPGKLQD